MRRVRVPWRIVEDSARGPTETETRKPLLIRVPVQIQGRMLVKPPLSDSSVVLIGFHGYAENAEDQLRRLQELDPESRLLLCSIQALHPFYTRSQGGVVASWMTRLDREAAFEKFVRAQSVWDTQMAWAARAVARETQRVFVVVGAGHVTNGWGIEHRLAELDEGAEVLSFVPWSGEGRPDPAEADLFFVCPAETDPPPAS